MSISNPFHFPLLHDLSAHDTVQPHQSNLFRTVWERLLSHPPTGLYESFEAEVPSPVRLVLQLEYIPSLVLLGHAEVFPSAGSWAQVYSD